MGNETRNKTGWRPKPKPVPLEESSDLKANPIERLKKAFFCWLNTRLGVVLAAMVVLPIMLWWQWDKIEKLPGVAPLVEKLDGFKALPQASGKSFSIVLARLADDQDDKHRKVISEALGRYSVVEILIASRMITSSGSDNMQEGIRLGHERARQLLVAPEL